MYWQAVKICCGFAYSPGWVEGVSARSTYPSPSQPPDAKTFTFRSSLLFLAVTEAFESETLLFPDEQVPCLLPETLIIVQMEVKHSRSAASSFLSSRFLFLSPRSISPAGVSLAPRGNDFDRKSIRENLFPISRMKWIYFCKYSPTQCSRDIQQC